MTKLKELYQKHKEILLYLVFGVITTIISLAVCFVTLKIGVIFLHDSNGEPTELLDIIGSTTQWISGVTVAFITNKIWVFTEAEKGAGATAKQFLVFSGSRVITYFLEVAINLLSIAIFEWLGYSPFAIIGIEITARVWAKVFSSIFVTVSNYFISKLFVFKKSKDKKNNADL
ncbi:MAG: GtrA family protein [Ruminococcaceae bacterium]|nr:GtrA family protein [Oscillospiraceae bacterium]